MGLHQQIENTSAAQDELEESIRRSITDVNAMRAGLDSRDRQIVDLQREVAMLQSEKQALALCLDHERGERAYYHRFAVEVSTVLGTIGVAVDEVVSKAQKAAQHDDGRRASDLPEIKVPEFLLRAREADAGAAKSEVAA